MSEPPRDYEALFVEHLPFVERVVATVAQVLGLRGADADDFAAWAKERLWQHDYAILRKWRGESRLTTYLTTVVTNLGREFRVQRWGRWRPSAAAQRLGPVAVRLETLVHRDGHTLAEAAVLLRQRGETTSTDRELAALLAELPVRERPRRVDDGDVALQAMPAATLADDRLAQADDDVQRRAAYAALDDALRHLPPDEQLVIRMHYLHGRTLADVARALHVPQKPLYRLKDRALATLAGRLRAAGIGPADVRALLGGDLDRELAPAAPGPDGAGENATGSLPSDTAWTPTSPAAGARVPIRTPAPPAATATILHARSVEP